MASSPVTESRLRLDAEFRDIKNELMRGKCRDLFDIHTSNAVRFQDMQRELGGSKPYLLHFSGHGSGDNGLCCEDDDGNSELLSNETLGTLLSSSSSLECVILNACLSSVQAAFIAGRVKYVIGMSKSISDKAALEFAKGFYRQLGEGGDLLDSFKAGANAVQHAVPDETATPELWQNGLVSRLPVKKIAASPRVTDVAEAGDLKRPPRLGPRWRVALAFVTACLIAGGSYGCLQLYLRTVDLGREASRATLNADEAIKRRHSSEVALAEAGKVMPPLCFVISSQTGRVKPELGIYGSEKKLAKGFGNYYEVTKCNIRELHHTDQYLVIKFFVEIYTEGTKPSIRLPGPQETVIEKHEVIVRYIAFEGHFQEAKIDISGVDKIQVEHTNIVVYDTFASNLAKVIGKTFPTFVVDQKVKAGSDGLAPLLGSPLFEEFYLGPKD